MEDLETIRFRAHWARLDYFAEYGRKRGLTEAHAVELARRMEAQMQAGHPPRVQELNAAVYAVMQKRAA